MSKHVPIYEYKCDDCGKMTELLENSGNRGVRKCAHCGSTKLTKQLSVFSARVKPFDSAQGRAGQSKKCFGCSDNKCPHSKR